MNVLPPAHSKWNNDMSAKFQKAKSISLWSVFNKLIAGPWDFLPMTKTKISNVALKWNNTDIYSRKIFSVGQSKSSYYMVRFLVVNLTHKTRINWPAKKESEMLSRFSSLPFYVYTNPSGTVHTFMWFPLCR